MARYARNAAILAKVETTVGTDAVPTGSADAVLVSDVKINALQANNVDRALMRPFFGASEQLVTTAYKTLSFSVELAGSGTAATAPQWGDLLLGCACSEALLATPNRVEYSPATSSLKTLTIYYNDDGVQHKLLAAMGTVKLSARVGQIPKLQFDFIGIDGGDTAVAVPVVTLTPWKTPPTMAKANVVDITLGCTYSLGAFTGGTVQNSTGLDIDFGNSVSFTALLNSEGVDVTDRAVSGKTQFDLAAAAEIANLASVKANTTQSLGLTIGTVAGNKIMLYAPAVQMTNPTKDDVNGRRVIGYDLRFVPSAGNDEIKIITQ